VTLANTIIAGNTAPTGPDVGGTVSSLGYNLIGNSSGGSGFAAADLLDVNPLLGPLQNNGGPTETMALLPGSLAIGAGSVALAVDANGNPLTADQRGSARIVNGAVDIGAFESRGFTITVASGNNQQTAVNTAFAEPLVVMVTSPYGEPVAGGAVTYIAPNGGPSATFGFRLGGFGPPTAIIDASGQASIAAAANGIPGSYTVSASARGAAGTSFDLTNTQGPATQLVIVTQPSATATAGRKIPTQPVIYVEDQYGNLETGDNSTQVTASLASGSGPLVETLTVTVSGGIATFTDLAEVNAGTISLLFTSVPTFTPVISSNILIMPAQPSQLVIHTQPSATAATGRPFATQPVIYEEDMYGNLETGDNSTQVTVGLGTGTGPLQGTTAVTVSGGIATFSGLRDYTAETIVLVFTSPTLTPATSNPITISSGQSNGQVIVGQAHVGSAAALAGVKAGGVHPGVVAGTETSRRKNHLAIRGRSLPATTKPHTHVAVRSRPRQSRGVPAGEVSSLQTVARANHARAVVRADSAPVRVSAQLKASLAAYLITLKHAGSRLS
jgi:hypothetical protein